MGDKGWGLITVGRLELDLLDRLLVLVGFPIQIRGEIMTSKDPGSVLTNRVSAWVQRPWAKGKPLLKAWRP